MAKIPLSIEELQARALAIRKQPGFSNVRNIAINRLTDEQAENNWSMCVLSAGAAMRIRRRAPRLMSSMPCATITI
jgi:hypothetical protein